MKEKTKTDEPFLGLGTNLGSSVTAELIARAGFDWIWIDHEHGVGDFTTLLHQLQAVAVTDIVPVVRVAWNDPVLIKKTLDLGAGGIMVPYVRTADDARAAVSAMQYPPNGIRGVARFVRAAGFGSGFDTYRVNKAPGLLTVVQIETADALKNVREIAAVDGVDVLFLGPLDLSFNLGVPQQYDSSEFKDAVRAIADACRETDTVAGALVPGRERIPEFLELGYRFLALGADGGLLASSMRSLLEEGRAATYQAANRTVHDGR